MNIIDISLVRLVVPYLEDDASLARHFDGCESNYSHVENIVAETTISKNNGFLQFVSVLFESNCGCGSSLGEIVQFCCGALRVDSTDIECPSAAQITAVARMFGNEGAGRITRVIPISGILSKEKVVVWIRDT